jgi:hypothetical protein
VAIAPPRHAQSPSPASQTHPHPHLTGVQLWNERHCYHDPQALRSTCPVGNTPRLDSTRLLTVPAPVHMCHRAARVWCCTCPRQATRSKRREPLPSAFVPLVLLLSSLPRSDFTGTQRRNECGRNGGCTVGGSPALAWRPCPRTTHAVQDGDGKCANACEL